MYILLRDKAFQNSDSDVQQRHGELTSTCDTECLDKQCYYMLDVLNYGPNIASK